MASFPVLPQTQALFSATFLPPPLDGSLTLNEIYDWHLEHNPEHKLFVCARDGLPPRVIYWGQAGRAVLRGAQLIKDMIAKGPPPAAPNKAPVVAILAISDTVTYWTLLMSVMKANCVVFPVSTRNSPTVVARLLTQVGADYVLVGPEPSMQHLANESMEVLKSNESGMTTPILNPSPTFEDIHAPHAEQDFFKPAADHQRRKLDRVVMYTHSSGSTSTPKPVPWTNRRILQYAMIPWFSNQDFTDKVFNIHAIPMYHAMGVLQIPMNASCGNVMACIEPGNTAAIPTPESLIQCARATSSDYIFCVPSYAEAWSRNPSHVEWLSKHSGIIYGGGSLNKAAGDHLASSGVHIAQLYGSTENAGVNLLCPGRAQNELALDWEYFTLPKYVEAYMAPQGSNTFELVIISTPWNTLTVTNSKVDGKDAFATSDLLEPHPDRPDYWRVYGRKDDQIVHSTGEKTNAGPLEGMICQDPHVAACVMFGYGRFQCGILVAPQPEFAFDRSDPEQLNRFRDKIWPTVAKMNELAPQHSRIFKEMIITSRASTPFAYTDKGTICRRIVLGAYENDIDALYATVENTTQISVQPPPQWTSQSTNDFVRSVVESVTKQVLTDDADLFEHGCDSLQATWIRNSVIRALRSTTPLDTRALPPSFVYENPTIARLSVFMMAYVSGWLVTPQKPSIAAAITCMHEMVNKYTHHLPTCASKRDSMTEGDEQEVVLITGTTGALGSYILAELIEDPKVSRIYAFNRSSGRQSSLLDRQRQSFIARGLNETLLYSSKVVLLAGDLLQPNLDLPSNAFNHLLNSVTHIIHCAWRVNMNLALSSFERNIKGLRSLVDFALTADVRPKFMFISSVAVLRNVQPDQVIREQLVKADHACGNGYAESKWVSEDILGEVATRTGLDVTIVRLGQISGGLNGCWNRNEWLPSMLRSAKDLQCLPNMNGHVSWVPLHIAGATVNECRSWLSPQTNTDNEARVIQVAHPRPVPYSYLMSTLSSLLSVPLVSYSEWISRMEKSPAAPAYQLISFFRELKEDQCHSVAFGLPQMDLSAALLASKRLRDSVTSPLGAADAENWLRFQFGVK